PRRDVAPGPDDLNRLTIDTADQMLFIVDPAIGTILPAKAVLHRMCSVLEQSGYFLLDSDQIIGVDPRAPEGRVLQVLRWRVAEHAEDTVADKRRCVIASSLEAVDHRR